MPSESMPSMLSLRFLQDPWACLAVVGVLGTGAMGTFGLMERFTGVRRQVAVGVFWLGYVLRVGRSAVALAFYYPWEHALNIWEIQQYTALSGAGCDTSSLVAAYGQATASTAVVPHISETVFNAGAVVLSIVMIYLSYDLRRSQRAGGVEGG